MNEIIIRKCKENDLMAIISLLKELQDFTSSHHELSEDSLSRIFKEMRKYPEIYVNFIAENEKFKNQEDS